MTAMVIQVPAEFKTLGEAMQGLLDAVRREHGQCAGGRPLAYAEVERRVAEQTAAIERAAHREILGGLAVSAPWVQIEGQRYRRTLFEPGTYYTLAGPVTVERWLYRESGKRNAKVVDPIRLRTGSVEDGWLPAAAEAMAFELQQGTAREAAQRSQKRGRLPYSRSSFERVAHAVARQYGTRHAEIDAACIGAYEVPPEAKSVTASLDRVSLPVEEPRQRPVGRPRKGAPKRPIARVYRMAYCGTVTLHDGEGRALHTIRYGRMPEPGGADLVSALAADVRAILAKRPDLQVALVCDGAPELWNLLRAELTAEKVGQEVHEIVDLWHVIEKLGKAAAVLHSTEAEVKAQLAHWALRLKNSQHAVGQILRELHASGTAHVTVGDCRPVHDAITYLTNQGDRMGYSHARCLGLPIGSGNVEATCKSLVEVRMKRSGSRWKSPTAQEILHLRALALSDRWNQAITTALAPLRRAVMAAA